MQWSNEILLHTTYPFPKPTHTIISPLYLAQYHQQRSGIRNYLGSSRTKAHGCVIPNYQIPWLILKTRFRQKRRTVYSRSQLCAILIPPRCRHRCTFILLNCSVKHRSMIQTPLPVFPGQIPSRVKGKIKCTTCFSTDTDNEPSLEVFRLRKRWQYVNEDKGTLIICSPLSNKIFIAMSDTSLAFGYKIALRVRGWRCMLHWWKLKGPTWVELHGILRNWHGTGNFFRWSRLMKAEWRAIASRKSKNYRGMEDDIQERVSSGT